MPSPRCYPCSLLQRSDEEPGEETPERGDPGNDPEGSGDGDGPVKKDPDVRRSRERTPSHELRTYQEAELRSFKRNDLIADVELLDGECTFVPYSVLRCPLSP